MITHQHIKVRNLKDHNKEKSSMHLEIHIGHQSYLVSVTHHLNFWKNLAVYLENTNKHIHPDEAVSNSDKRIKCY